MVTDGSERRDAGRGGVGLRGVCSWSIRVCAPGKLLLLCSALEVEPEQNRQDQHQQSMGEGRGGEGRRRGRTC